MAQTLLQTPLHDRHVALGARMVPFAGWEMPVQYEGVIPVHRAVRTNAGVFDDTFTVASVTIVSMLNAT